MTKLIEILQNHTVINDVDFSKTTKAHDWKNYVGEFKDCWNELTLREKQIIQIMAKEQASKEDWE